MRIMSHKHSLSSGSRSSSSSSINSDDGTTKEVRIAVVGQGGVGKSGTTHCYLLCPLIYISLRHSSDCSFYNWKVSSFVQPNTR